MELERLLTDRRQAGFAMGLGLAVAGVALYLGLMVRHALWLRAVGPICGEHSAALHCPGCYAAMALVALGASIMAAPPALRLRPTR